MGVCNLVVDANQILRRPVAVVEGVPSPHIVVKRNRPRHVFLVNGALNIGQDLLKLELRRVDPQYHQPDIGILLMPLLQERQGAKAVHARVGPEVDQHHVALASLICNRGRSGVQPRIDTNQVCVIPARQVFECYRCRRRRRCCRCGLCGRRRNARSGRFRCRVSARQRQPHNADGRNRNEHQRAQHGRNCECHRGSHLQCVNSSRHLGWVGWSPVTRILCGLPLQ